MPSSHKTKTAKPPKKQRANNGNRPGIKNIAGQGFHTNPERINKKGRPKKLPEIDKLMVEVLGSVGEKKSEAQAILEALTKQAKKGNVRAAEVLLDRGYGKLKQTVDANLITEQPFFPDLKK